MKNCFTAVKSSILSLLFLGLSFSAKSQIIPGVGNIVKGATELILPDSIDGISFFRVDHLEVNELSFLKGQMILGEGLSVMGDGNFESNLFVEGNGIFKNLETGFLVVDTLIATQSVNIGNNLLIGNDGIIENNLTVKGITRLNDDVYAFPVSVDLSNTDLENTGIALIDENGKFIRTSLASVLREAVNGDPCTSTLQPAGARWSYSGDNITTSQCRPDAKVGIRTSQPSEALEVIGSLFLNQNTGTHSLSDNTIFFSDKSNYLKSTSATGFQLTTDGGSNGLTLNEAGNLGIGVYPNSRLTVGGNAYIQGLGGFNGIGDEAILSLGDNNHFIKSEFGEGVTIGTKGNSTDLHLHQDGGIGIGTDSPQAALHIKSKEEDSNIFLIQTNAGADAFLIKEDANEQGKPKVYAQEINVKTSPFPDYVFNDDYKLKTIKQVAKFIEKNGKLSGMPSAEEVHENGLDLGEVNRVLVEKVEELTLYTIQQQEQIEAQQALLKQMQKQLQKVLDQQEK